jgi:hypothetical protein
VIRLPYGGKNVLFDEQALISIIVKSGRDYIIQGQQNCSLADHTKPNSLDYWLRVNYASNADTKQAVNEVVDQLMKTGLFQLAHDLRCPNSGRLCKGLRIKSNRVST